MSDTINLSFPDGTTGNIRIVPVPATIVGAWAYHANTALCGDDVEIDAGHITITHVASGFALGSVFTFEDALAIIERANEVCDPTAIDPNQPATFAALKAIAPDLVAKYGLHQ